MADSVAAIWLGAVLVVEAIAILVAFWYLFMGNNQSLHPVLKVAVAFMVFGIAIQCFRTVHFFEFGRYPVDKYFPLWVTKDIGICIAIYYYAFIHPKITGRG